MSNDENTAVETEAAEQREETAGDGGESTAALAARVAELEAGLAERDQRMAGLNGALAQRDARIAELTDAVGGLERAAEERERQSEGVKAQLSQALEAYRASLLAAEPGLPGDLLVGDSVEELQASHARARQIVEQVRGRIEEEALLERTPAGAPARSDFDASALSPEEKIRLGLSRR